MSQLRKLIVLTPEQLQRLRGRHHDVTDQYDANRLQVLESVLKKVKDIGPTQAYAQYQVAQQRHLHHAAKDRTEPLQMTFAEPPSAPPTLQEQLQKLEQQQEQAAAVKRAQEEAALRKAGRSAAFKRRQREENDILSVVKRATETKANRENVLRVQDLSPLKTRSKTLKKGLEHVLQNRGEAKWISLRQ